MFVIFCHNFLAEAGLLSQMIMVSGEKNKQQEQMSASPQKSSEEDLIKKTGENRNRTCRKKSPTPQLGLM